MDSRTEAVERCLSVGRPVYADKVPAPSLEKTRELLVLAERQGVATGGLVAVALRRRVEPLKKTEGGAAPRQ